MNTVSPALQFPTAPELTPGELKSCVNSSLCSMKYDVATRKAGAPPATYFSALQLGPIGIFHYAGIGMWWGRRDISHVRADQIDDFILTIPLHGEIRIRQSGTFASVGPDSFIYTTTSKPYEASIHAIRKYDGFSAYSIKIPGTLLRQHIPRMDHCCGRVIKIGPGTGKIMVSMIQPVLIEGSSLSENQAHRLGMMIIDAVANATLEAPELLVSQSPNRQTAPARIVERAKSYIESNLSRPQLDSSSIAEHCNVSVRYLNAAFATQAMTVGSFIRELRLERCRSALQNPALSDMSVAKISYTWGFNDPAYFSRAYKQKFGRTPGRERLHAKYDH